MLGEIRGVVDGQSSCCEFGRVDNPKVDTIDFF